MRSVRKCSNVSKPASHLPDKVSAVALDVLEPLLLLRFLEKHQKTYPYLNKFTRPPRGYLQPCAEAQPQNQ